MNLSGQEITNYGIKYVADELCDNKVIFIRSYKILFLLSYRRSEF
jgi:hypothetical protein